MSKDWDDVRQECGEIQTAKLAIESAYIPELLDESTSELSAPRNIDFDLSSRNRPKQTKRNLKALLNAYNITVRYNLIKKMVEVVGPGMHFTPDNYEEASRTEVISLCHDHEMPVSHVHDYLTVIADENQFNPMKEFLESRPWDGISRIDELMQTINTKSNDIRDSMLRKWMIGCVRSWLSVDGMATPIILVLQGAQGIGKDRWCKALFPKSMSDYILEGHSVHPHNKDSLINAVRHAITILSELGASNQRRTQDDFKAWITTDKDKIRLPFGRAERVMPRRVAMIATVNELDFLKDDTGNRRFAPLELVDINADHGIDMQQLWAEVYELSKGPDQIHWLTQEEIIHLQKHNEQFEETSSVEERIFRMYDWEAPRKRFVTATEICQEIGIQNPSRTEMNQASKGARRCLELERNAYSKRGRNGERFFLFPDRPNVSWSDVGQTLGRPSQPSVYGDHRE